MKNRPLIIYKKGSEYGLLGAKITSEELDDDYDNLPVSYGLKYESMEIAGSEYVELHCLSELWDRFSDLAQEFKKLSEKELTPQMVANYIADNDLKIEQTADSIRIYKDAPKFEVDVSATKKGCDNDAS